MTNPVMNGINGVSVAAGRMAMDKKTELIDSAGFMKLPSGEQAEISMVKLVGYCLNPNHPRGKNKARVFRAVLGITAENANRLNAFVRQAAIEGEVVQQTETPFG